MRGACGVCVSRSLYAHSVFDTCVSTDVTSASARRKCVHTGRSITQVTAADIVHGFAFHHHGGVDCSTTEFDQNSTCAELVLIRCAAQVAAHARSTTDPHHEHWATAADRRQGCGWLRRVQPKKLTTGGREAPTARQPCRHERNSATWHSRGALDGHPKAPSDVGQRSSSDPQEHQRPQASFFPPCREELEQTRSRSMSKHHKATLFVH